MKIGLVLRHFDPQRGGAERWTWDLARRAVAAGYEVHAIAQRFTPALRSASIVPQAITPTHCPYAFAEAIHEKVQSLDLDVVHDMGFGWHFDILQPHMGAARGQFERKLMAMSPGMRWTRRALSAASLRRQRAERVCWRQYADHRRLVIALSKLVARDLERFHGWPLERSRLIYNGVNTAHFTPANREEHRDTMRRQLKSRADELLVLFVAHNFALKGLATLVRAVGQLRQANRPVRLLVIGNDRPASYARLARQHGAGDAVQFLGAIEDVVPYYAAADVFALPTWYDSCSLVVLEALASGLPVITTSHNGAAEILTDGFDGFVVDDPGDWSEFAGRLKALLDPALRGRMSVASRKLAERYPLEANHRQVMDVWQQVAGRMRQAA